ncbi:tetratricopeptide repeat protein [Streptosporangium sp. NPDC049304]|uniref:ATP-binding protein n=1 Tax=Streptosporangium sp. NPDC049304 TaxID=3154830 RepID=UPI00341291F7
MGFGEHRAPFLTIVRMVDWRQRSSLRLFRMIQSIPFTFDLRVLTALYRRRSCEFRDMCAWRHRPSRSEALREERVVWNALDRPGHRTKAGLSSRNTVDDAQLFPPQQPITCRKDLGAALRHHKTQYERKNGKRNSVSALVKRVAVSRSSLYAYLNGGTLPDAVTLDRLLAALEVSDEERRRLGTARDVLAEAMLGRHALEGGGADENTVVPPRPFQLPGVSAHFFGRDQELATLAEMVEGKSVRGGATTIVVVSGMPGVGKTSLVLSFAHQVADRFPDGVLYVDLRGYSPDRPKRPSEALKLFLSALRDDDADLPQDEEGRVALYRSLVADRRMLIVLDNANTPDQVRPLLPNSAKSVVLVTSRSNLPALIGNGAIRLPLERLPHQHAVCLLGRVITAERVERERVSADELVRTCAYLPLALLIVAQRVLLDPQVSLAHVVTELAGAKDRLHLLATPDDDRFMNVGAVFSWSYRALTEPQAHMFRLLALHAGADVSVDAAAALCGRTTSEARRALEVLASVNLLEPRGGDRYAFHDLLREYAAERAHEHPVEEGRQAVRRVLEWYCHTARSASRILLPYLRPVDIKPSEWGCPPPRFTRADEALQWCEAERANLVSAVRQAVEREEYDIGWRLPAALSGFFNLRKPWEEWIECCRLGLEAARGCGERTGETWSLTNLGLAYWGLGELDKALECHNKSLAVCREIDDRWGEGIVLSCLGDIHRDLARLDSAIECYGQARDIFLEIQERWGAGLALHNLGHAYTSCEQYGAAIDCYLQTLSLSDELGDDPWGKAQTLHYLADAYRLSGSLDDAVETYRKALVIRREIGDARGEAITLDNLGIAQDDAGLHQQARRSWELSVEKFVELRDTRAADAVRTRLR